MNTITNDNTVFVIEKLFRRFKFKISSKSIQLNLLEHPHYPNLKSICDSLKKWGIEHYPLKLEMNEILELEIPFIAHLNQSGGELAYVEKITNDAVIYYIAKGEKQIESFDEFSKKLSGAVILVSPEQNIIAENYKKDIQNQLLQKSLLPLIIATIVGFIVYELSNNWNSSFNTSITFLALSILAVLGTITSVFLVLHELKIHTTVGDKLCGFNSKTDCDTVLSSNASKVFGNINWADAGLVYFIGTLIFLSGSNSISSLSNLSIVSALVLPYPVFSIYYQAVKLKKWCPFCLLTQIILIAAFVVLLPVYKNLSFSASNILLLIVSYAIPAIIWILYKSFNEEVNVFNQKLHELITFKRNPEVFKSILKLNNRVEFNPDNNDLILGNPNAPITITVFLSLYCNPCSVAFKKLYKLVKHSSEINIHAIVSVYDDELTHKIITELYKVYKNDSYAALEFLNNWYNLKPQNRESFIDKIQLEIKPEFISMIKANNQQLFKKYEIPGTPTIFINGFKQPDQYNIEDFKYFSEEIIQLTLESKRQEAHTVQS